MVTNLSPYFGFIDAQDLGTVYFTALSFKGETHQVSESLFDVLAVGDAVQVTAAPHDSGTGCAWKATSVRPTENLEEKATQTYRLATTKTETIKNAQCQTGISPQMLLFRTVLNDTELYQLCLEKYPYVMSYINRTKL